MSYLQQGMPFTVPLLMCSILALAIIAERFFYLHSSAKENSFALWKINECIERNDVDGIEEFCVQNPGLLSGIFVNGVRKFKQLRGHADVDFVQREISKMMEDASIVNTADLENRLPLLATVGNVAPLFGFAGTVTGMMTAFEKIAQTSNPSAQVVAGGIREALITTAAGLVIAIPTVMVHTYFSSQIDGLNARTEESANEMIDMMVTGLVDKQTAKA